MHPAELVIRRAKCDDAALLADLGTRTFIETFGHLYRPADLAAYLAEAHSPAAWAQWLADPAVAIWLASLGSFDPGAPVGYLAAGPCKLPVPVLESRAGEIRRLYLLGAVQNRGIGRQLMAVALDWLAVVDYRPLYVGVWSENFGAQRFYARYGFVKIGEYDFPVGTHLDREFIFRQPCDPRATGRAQPVPVGSV